jgi:acetylornithine deacetylase/succinyl-diaminopimelate desuccinylase-like protein
VRGHAVLFALTLALGGCGRAVPPAGAAAPEPLPERTPLAAWPRTEADWQELSREATRLLATYLRINTTNPPGNELAAARWLAAVLRRDGIEARIFEPLPGKANLYARLAGDGSARPLILLNHMDVVLASADHWQVDPFAGVIRDGYIWGRGALDMKGEAIVQLMTLLALKRAGVPLKRDIIFLATADEEIGVGVGAGWIVREHPELVRDAEFLLTEGGTLRATGTGQVEYYGIGTTEKSPFWLDVTSRGTPGHGSRPTADNPVHRLLRALARLEAHRTPLVVTPVVERYFRELAAIEGDPARRRWFANIRAALDDTAAVRAITADPTYNALLRNTVAVTGLKGSDKTNVIPPVATAAVDVRLLPGEDPAAVLAELTRVVADSAVMLTPQGPNWPATESPSDGELAVAITAAARARHPGAVVTPFLLTGFTDSHHFRRLGIASYGVTPFPLTAADSRGVHGNDERLSLDALRFGLLFFSDIVVRVAGR